MSERLYRPSNVTEGDMFMDGLCFRCKKEKACQILSDTFIYGITDKEYPRQWVYRDGEPTCTAFKDADAPEPFRHHVKPLPGQRELF